MSFLSPRCPHTAPQCGPAEIHGCFILGVLRGVPEKYRQSGAFQQVCDGVSKDKVFHKTAVLRQEPKQMQFGDAKLLSGTKTVPAVGKVAAQVP